MTQIDLSVNGTSRTVEVRGKVSLEADAKN